MFKVKSKLSQTERHCTWQLHFSARNAASRYTLWCICCSLWRISAPGTPGSKGRRGVDGKVKSGTWCWISVHFKTEGACLTTGVFNIKNGATLLWHYFAYNTTMLFWSSSDAPGNLLLQVFPNDAQCQVLPWIFCWKNVKGRDPTLGCLEHPPFSTTKCISPWHDGFSNPSMLQGEGALKIEAAIRLLAGGWWGAQMTSWLTLKQTRNPYMSQLLYVC